MTQSITKQTVPIRELHELMIGDKIGTQYQPIIDLHSEEIFAWEALARFIGRTGELIPPDLVFQALHFSPLSLFQMEHRLKVFQLAHAPDSGRLFLNIDQDAFDIFRSERTNPLVDVIAGNVRVVVEIIENSSISDARISASMGDIYSGLGIPLALDDIGAHFSMVDLNLLPKVDYLKLSLDWIGRIAQKDARALLETIISYSKNTGKKTILEGVETPKHFKLARDLDVDYVQGFKYRHLFREAFQHKEKNAVSTAA